MRHQINGIPIPRLSRRDLRWYSTRWTIPVARAQAIAGVLEPIGATIEPLSTLDRGVLVATFPDRAFAGPNGAAFAAAHRFQEVFDLEAAEPDLPTDLFPDDIVLRRVR